MKISILLGSIRQDRQSHRLAYYIKDQMMEKGIIVNWIDLKDYSLSLFGSPISNQEIKSVGEIGSYFKEAEAIVIVTPEYHSNIPAALENILEYCGKDLLGKITGVASASASKYGGLQASNNLQITLLNLGAYPISRRLLVPEIHFAFDQNNKPVKSEIKEQVEKFIRELMAYVTLRKSDPSENKVAT